MASKYSKNSPLKSLTIEDGDAVRTYKANKLNTRTLMTEGFKILKVFLPSIGTGIDQVTNRDDLELEIPNTFAAMFMLLNDNLTEEHFEELSALLLGNLVCNGSPVEDIDDHFDRYPEDIISVLAWAGKGNFYNFFMGNHMIRSKIQEVKTMIQTKLMPTLQDSKLFNGIDTGNED